MGGTYGGNAVACVAANTVLDEFAKSGLLENVNARSKQFLAAAEKWKTQFPGLIADVRGLGLMLAIEFNTSGQYVRDDTRVIIRLSAIDGLGCGVVVWCWGVENRRCWIDSAGCKS